MPTFVLNQTPTPCAQAAYDAWLDDNEALARRTQSLFARTTRALTAGGWRLGGDAFRWCLWPACLIVKHTCSDQTQLSTSFSPPSSRANAGGAGSRWAEHLQSKFDVDDDEWSSAEAAARRLAPLKVPDRVL